MIFGMCVILSNIKVLVMSYIYTWAMFIGMTSSLLAYLLFFGLTDKVDFLASYKAFSILMRTPNFHLGNILCIGST